MGTSRVVPYTVHVRTDKGAWTPSEWRTRPQGVIPADGKPTQENLAKWVAGYEKSTQPGGVNSHLGATKILSAWIVRQSDGATLVRYAPAPTDAQV